MTKKFNNKPFQKSLTVNSKKYTYFNINALEKHGFKSVSKLPFSIKILLESALRNYDNYSVTLKDIENITKWSPNSKKLKEIAFKPGRVVLQDFTGVPCVVDLAAMRNGLKDLGGDYKKINPQVPCDLVIDHSVQVDAFGSSTAMQKNVSLEFKRNKERYEFLKWGQNAFKNFRVVPPATGIVHQVNLEYLAKGVLKNKSTVFPDSLVGTDSHTTMINGLGIVGWGVGGIEAEAVMLGEPIYMLLPEVIGFKLTGRLKEGITATDMVLTVTQMLRAKGVVGKFVEFFGPGLKNLSLPDRATISNMAPEYGATIGIFPIDDETLNYYRLTGRTKGEVALVEKYMKAQGMFYDGKTKSSQFTDCLELNLDSVEPSLAGPKRPQDRVPLKRMKEEFKKQLSIPIAKSGFGISKNDMEKSVKVNSKINEKITHGSVVIAAITSCTNTSNPSVLVAAGLLAKKAVEKGLKVKKYVKTSFAPGSQVVEEYMRNSGLQEYLNKLKFNIVGYGCTTCIGNSGPLPENVRKAVVKGDLVSASVLSGNRNFEGRVNPHVKANYLASPPLVVAFALAGRADINLNKEALGKDKQGNEIFLKDIWPTQEEINTIIAKTVTSQSFNKRYKNVSHGNKNWNDIKSTTSDLYKWKEKSTYIQQPPFFEGMNKETGVIDELKGVRCLVKVGDSITTDHISPAGAIALDSPAGQYLVKHGVKQADFNSYGSRRGNDRIMTRGTFANIRLRNQLAPGTEGSWTMCFVNNRKMSIFDAAEEYKKKKIPLIVLAGKEYGTGSSRDWAAKGTALLGVKAVLAQSYERIHRSNLAGMGVIPLEFKNNESADTLGLTGEEVFEFNGINNTLTPRKSITVIAHTGSKQITFHATCRLDTPVEIDYVRNGGILQTVLKKLA